MFFFCWRDFVVILNFVGFCCYFTRFFATKANNESLYHTHFLYVRVLMCMSPSSPRTLCVVNTFLFYPFFMITLFIFGVLWFFHIFFSVVVVLLSTLESTRSLFLHPYGTLCHSNCHFLHFIFFTRPPFNRTKQSTCSFLCVCVLIEPLLFIISVLVYSVQIVCMYTSTNDVFEWLSLIELWVPVYTVRCTRSIRYVHFPNFCTLFIHSRHTSHTIKSFVFLSEMHY